MDEALEEARLEWDFVEQNQDAQLANEQGEAASAPLSLSEALALLNPQIPSSNVDFPALKRPQDLGFFSRFFRTIFGPTFIQEKNINEVSNFIKMASMGLEKLPDLEQMRLLSTLYFNLMGRNPVSRFGAHWGDIGFQGCVCFF